MQMMASRGKATRSSLLATPAPLAAVLLGPVLAAVESLLLFLVHVEAGDAAPKEATGNVRYG
jgi:hypothetical protein